MSYLLGIDVGTSGIKSVLMETSGTLLDTALCEYSIDTPNPDWAEQDPQVWWQATAETIRRVLANSGIDRRNIAGIGFSGQMHGTVFLGRSNKVIRPAIIWADQRSTRQCQEILAEIGRDHLAELTANPIALSEMLLAVDFFLDKVLYSFECLLVCHWLYKLCRVILFPVYSSL